MALRGQQALGRLPLPLRPVAGGGPSVLRRPAAAGNASSLGTNTCAPATGRVRPRGDGHGGPAVGSRGRFELSKAAASRVLPSSGRVSSGVAAAMVPHAATSDVAPACTTLRQGLGEVTVLPDGCRIHRRCGNAWRRLSITTPAATIFHGWPTRMAVAAGQKCLSMAMVVRGGAAVTFTIAATWHCQHLHNYERKVWLSQRI